MTSLNMSTFISMIIYAHTGFRDAQDIRVFDDHPVLEIFRGVENSTNYVDKNMLDNILLRCIIQVILRWANMLNCRLRVWASYAPLFYFSDSLPRFRSLLLPTLIWWNDCVIWQTRFIEYYRHARTIIITMVGPYNVQLEPISIPPTSQYSIALSWDLLDCISIVGWNCRIPRSFTNFITTPEYISPDIYHTQLEVTEYLLRNFISEPFSFCIDLSIIILLDLRPRIMTRPELYLLKEHLSRALPTKMIYNISRSELLIRDYSAELMLDTLEIIIKCL